MSAAFIQLSSSEAAFNVSAPNGIEQGASIYYVIVIGGREKVVLQSKGVCVDFMVQISFE